MHAPDTQMGPTSRLDELMRPDRVAQLSVVRDNRSTGYEPFDGVLGGGFAPEELVVVGGRPGVGKSVALLQWSRNLARAGRNVTMAYYEHSELTVLCHLLLVELGEGYPNASDTIDARRVVDEIVSGRTTWADAVAGNDQVRWAADRVDIYAGNLTLLDRMGRRGGLEALEASVDSSTEVLIVDHLRKVDEGTPGASIGATASYCKALAVDAGITVVASTVVHDDGINMRRLRMGHLADAAAVAHESDIELVLNDKLPIVSRNHTAFDSVRAETFRNQVVLSIEKNRRGLSGVDIEFTRDFAHRRFVTEGAFVTEHLIDDVMVIE